MRPILSKKRDVVTKRTQTVRCFPEKGEMVLCERCYEYFGTTCIAIPEATLMKKFNALFYCKNKFLVRGYYVPKASSVGLLWI